MIIRSHDELFEMHTLEYEFEIEQDNDRTKGEHILYLRTNKRTFVCVKGKYKLCINILRNIRSEIDKHGQKAIIIIGNKYGGEL